MKPVLALILLFAPVFVAGEECRDLVKDCYKAERYCKSKRLHSVLLENCKLTCRHCTPGSKPNTKPKPKPHSEPKQQTRYKLHYFKFRLRGEPVRLMFTYKNVKFEDNQIDPKDWPKLKPNYPNGQVPLLEIDNKNFTQSLAIYRHVANALGLFGKDDLERIFLDSTAELFRECLEKATPFIQYSFGVVKGDKDKAHDELFVPAMQKYALQMEKILTESGSGFIAPSGISWVDFYVAGAVRTFNNLDSAIMAKYPLLIAHNKRIYSLKELQAYFAKNPPAPF